MAAPAATSIDRRTSSMHEKEIDSQQQQEVLHDQVPGDPEKSHYHAPTEHSPDARRPTSSSSNKTPPPPANNTTTSSNSNNTPTDDVPPDGGYGWVCVACCFWLNAHTWGLNSSYAVFLAYYLSHATFPGATNFDYALVGGLSISMAMLVSPIATTTTRLFGTRTTLLIGVFFETLAFIGASFAKQIWHLFLTQGVCFGWGMGFLFVGSVGIPPQWFTSKRSLANGISAAGSGVGGLTYSLATQAMIDSVGLPWAFRILAILAFTVNTTCSLLLRDRNKAIGSSQLAFDRRLFRKIEFDLLLAFGFLSMLAYVTLLFSLPNYAHSIGLTAKQGSILGAVLNLGQALGRPPIGYFSDRMGRLNMAGVMTFLAGLFSLVIWIPGKSFGVLIFFAIVGGMVAGTFWAVIAPVSAEIVGIKEVPSALSITWLVLVLPTTFSEAIALEITASEHGKYLGAQLFTGFMYLGAASCLWVVRAMKIGENERVAMEKEGGSEGEGGALTSTAVSSQSSSFVKRLVVIRRV